MKKGTRNILKIIISLIYIVWGIMSPISAIKAVIALDIGAIASAAVGVLMLLAGIFGIAGIKREKCRVFGIIIFIFSIVSAVLVLMSFNLESIIRSGITAVLAWLFIACV